MPIVPLSGDRAAHDVTNYPSVHASDLEAGTPIHHVPAGSVVGDVLTWDGSKWNAGAAPQSGELWALYKGSKVTLDPANGGGSFDGQPMNLDTVITDEDALVSWHMDEYDSPYLYFAEEGWYFWQIRVAVNILYATGSVGTMEAGTVSISATPYGYGAGATAYYKYTSTSLNSTELTISGVSYLYGQDEDYGNVLDLYCQVAGPEKIEITIMEMYIVKKSGGASPL